MNTLIKLTLLPVLVLSSFNINGNFKPQDAYQLGIEITTNLNGTPLYIPVGSAAKKKRMFITLPVKSDGLMTSALRIVPILEDGQVKVDLFYLSDDYWKTAQCVDIQMLRSSRTETRIIRWGESLELSEAQGKALATIKVVELRPETTQGAANQALPPQAGPCGCAQCGVQNPLWCCPAKGRCLTCGNCGQVCCPNNGDR